MVSDEVTASLAKFFEAGRGPSHDELDRLIDRAGLSSADPRRDDPVAGKMKRVRAVLWYSTKNDAEAGSALVEALIAALRAAGCFRSNDPNYPGASSVESLQAALDAVGYDLSEDGVVRPKSMEGLDGAELTEALWTYVRRARTAGADSALRIGTAKDLSEATARHVLVERIGEFPAHGNFAATLWQAYEALSLSTPARQALEMLDGDAWSSVEQAIFLLACAINRYRNEEGIGHGQPRPCIASDAQSQIAAEGSALASEVLLQALA
jgi:hypothetical protein